MGLDQLDGVLTGPEHEAGWLSSGWPWRRTHRAHCNTCGATSDPLHDLRVIKAVAATHSAFPGIPINRVLVDAIEFEVRRKRALHQEGP